jgi:hypothetical protein
MITAYKPVTSKCEDILINFVKKLYFVTHIIIINIIIVYDFQDSLFRIV